MNKIIYILVLIIILSGCDYKKDIDTSDGEDIEINIDQQYYSSNFEAYLNEDDFDSSIFSNNLLDTPFDESIDADIGELTESDVPDEDITVEHNIVDQYGNIIGSGTEAESLQAQEQFEAASAYEVLNYSIIDNKLRLKVYNKYLQKAQLYSIKLEGNKMDSYIIYD